MAAKSSFGKSISLNCIRISFRSGSKGPMCAVKAKSLISKSRPGGSAKPAKSSVFSAGIDQRGTAALSISKVIPCALVPVNLSLFRNKSLIFA